MQKKGSGNLSRRKFINLGVQGYAGIQLTQALGTSLLASGCETATARTVAGACYHDCPDTCSWKITVSGEKVTRFEANKENLFTAGKLCDKMTAFPADVTYHPDRLLQPLKRTGKKGQGTFAPVSWEQAIGEVAGKLSAIVADKGREAVLPFVYAGTQGLIQGSSLSNRFFGHLGSSMLEGTICGAPAYAGVSATNGDALGVLPEDIVHSRYIVLWGVNTMKSNQHLWPFILHARQQGARIVVIDPMASATARQADWHVQPAPGTDTALALGLIHIILSEQLQDQDYIDRYTSGIEALGEHVAAYPLARVAEITGLEPAAITTLAREYAGSSPSLIRVLIGLEHHASGSDAFRAVAMLPALTGAWRHQGGGLMHFTFEAFGQALNWEALDFHKTLNQNKRRAINMVQLGRALNDTSLQPAIGALFVHNANPAATAPNQNLVLKGLEREDLFTVVLEHFMTDTARYADYVFPATSQLEHWDLMDSWGQTYLNLNEQAISPLGEAKSNNEFFRLLSAAMGYEAPYLFEDDLSIIKKTLDSSHPYLEGITFESLREQGWAKLKLPSPWLPHAEGNFVTPSGKCEFYSHALEANGEEPLPQFRPVQYSADSLKQYPLHLLTVKTSHNFLNTSHANVAHLLEKEGAARLDMHEADARERNISDGDIIRVFNERGEVLVRARISDRLLAGVVNMPQGYWSSLMEGGSSANALTQDLLTDRGRGAALQEARVQVARV